MTNKDFVPGLYRGTYTKDLYLNMTAYGVGTVVECDPKQYEVGFTASTWNMPRFELVNNDPLDAIVML